jgi:hypothetical protein
MKPPLNYNYERVCVLMQDKILGALCPLFTSLENNPTGSGSKVWYVRPGRTGTPMQLQGLHSAMANNLFSPNWNPKPKGAGALDKALNMQVPTTTHTARLFRGKGTTTSTDADASESASAYDRGLICGTWTPVAIPQETVRACPGWVGFGPPPNILALVETLMGVNACDTAQDVAKARGISVAASIQQCVGLTSVPARDIPPTEAMPRDARVCLGALHHMGLRVFGTEVPVASPVLGFATAVDVLATDAQNRLVVVEVKTACGGVDWGDPVQDPPVGGWCPPLDFLPRCLRWEAAVQAWMATRAMHTDYNVPTHCLAWVVLIYRGPMIRPLVTYSADPLDPANLIPQFGRAMRHRKTRKRKFPVV